MRKSFQEELDHLRLQVELMGVRVDRLRGDDAVRIATHTLIAGRSPERIADHAAMIGARLRYLLAGDPDHLTAEVR